MNKYQHFNVLNAWLPGNRAQVTRNGYLVTPPLIGVVTVTGNRRGGL